MDAWATYKANVLVPSIKSSNWYCLNTVNVMSYVPSMEKVFENAVTSFRNEQWRKSWLGFMRCATFILEELRNHPHWSRLSAEHKNRLMTVLATRSVSYAETCEKYMRSEFHIARQKAKEIKEAQEAKEKIIYRSSISMYVNGEKCSVPDTMDPHMRLVDFLRDVLGKTGTKIGCGEGGCGACSVLLSYEQDQNANDTTAPTHRVINSCLRSIASCDGAYITTVEGIGAKGPKQTIHPTQERLAQCNGSQCGFCSPGWVMNAYSMLMNDASPTSVQAVQDRFDGNLCRCTGFRSILHAFSSFVPSEEQKDEKKGHILAPYDAKKQQALANLPLPEDISPQQLNTPLHLEGGKHADWFAPNSLSELSTILQSIITDFLSFEFILGGSSRAVNKYYNGEVNRTSIGNIPPDAYVSLFRVKELHNVTVTTDGTLTAGSAVTLSTLISYLKSETKDPMFLQLSRHLSRVATLQVRNVGGWAGNLAMAKQFPTFPSDVLTTLATAGATLTIQRWNIPSDTTAKDAVKVSVVPTFEHLTVAAWAMEAKNMAFVDVIMSLTIPSSFQMQCHKLSDTAPRTSFSTYKLAKRQQNAHAIVNFACHLNMHPLDNTVLSATIFFHGDDKCALTHAISCCNVLLGKDITLDSTLAAALLALENDLNGGRSAYVVAASQALLYKSVLAAQPSPLPPSLLSATDWQLPRGISTGTEVWTPPDPAKEPPPAGLGRTKNTAILQCTGQAKYTSDFTSEQKQFGNGIVLHAVPVQSTRALAIISSLDPSVATNMDDIVRVIGAGDIDVTIGMVNDCGIEDVDNGGNASPEKIFVEVGGKVETTGQTIALVVGKTREAAKLAAQAMMDPATGGVVYQNVVDAKGVRIAPILSLDDAIAQKAFYVGEHCDLVEKLADGVKNIDDALASCEHVWQGTLRAGGQRHFYMETQRAFVRPTENEGLHVRSSTQGPTVTAKYVGRATGRNTSQVECEQVRAGVSININIT